MPTHTEMHTMLRVRVFLLTCLTTLLAATSAPAGWHEFWDRVHLDFHRNNCWDEPFTTIDRRAARAPFAAMIHSGWRSQNTLGKHYFDRETNVLNEAGEQKLFWIVNHAPEPYRTIFVTQSLETDVSEQRIDSVQQSLVQMLPEQALPAVLPTREEPRGWPADYIDAIDRKQQSTLPAPRLPSFQAAGSVGGGSPPPTATLSLVKLDAGNLHRALPLRRSSQP